MKLLEVSGFTPEADTHLQEIGRRIRAHRKALRISAIATAEAAGISRVTLHRIEKGEPSVNAGAYACAALVLGLVLVVTEPKPRANSDRWADDSVFSRDLIDLAMMRLPLALLRAAADKARGAYGDAIHADLRKALDRMDARAGWLDRCMQSLAMNAPRAMVWQNLRALRRLLPR